jgi:16S rRNA (cytosine967-C5)-methyltransferase
MKRRSVSLHSSRKALGPRVVAANTLCEVVNGSSLSDTLVKHLSDVEPKDRALVQELCYGVLRWWQRLQWIAHRLLQRPIKAKDRDVEILILIGIYQLLYMRTPSHAAVAETVEGSRGLGKSWASGLINGVLRSLIRDGDVLLSTISEDISAELSCPSWLLDTIQKAWPDKWRIILQATNSRPPMSLRVNIKRCSRAEYVGMLQSESITARPISDVKTGLVLDSPLDVLKLPGFTDGLVSVQDGAAQLAAQLMSIESGDKVLDLCAAPGGKTCHMLEMAPESTSLTAVDINAERLQKVQENLDRLGLKAELYTGDAADPKGVWAETKYDRILLDVPCSATGVIRRHPDIKLLRRAEDISKLAELQQQILRSAWKLLKPGGVLVYVTCSLLPQENEEQIERFLSEASDAYESSIDEHWGYARSFGRQTIPGENAMDGFFYARIQKQS